MQAYSLRGSARKDVAQVDESVVQNLVAGCRADRVASSSRFARRDAQTSQPTIMDRKLSLLAATRTSSLPLSYQSRNVPP